MASNQSHDNFDDDKENQQNIESICKQPRVTKDQYSKMDDFHSKHNELLLERTVLNQLWTNLASELNDIGPPAHTVSEWRRKWSTRKYYQKQQLLKKELDSENDEPLDSEHTSNQANSVDLQILEKLNEISCKLDTVIRNQNDTTKSQHEQ